MNIVIGNTYMDYSAMREIEQDGHTWLVVNGVPIVEGVLGSYLVPYEEFGAFPVDWNDVPLVLGHPQTQGGSARVASPDVPVVGRFHNASLDPQGRRLVGEFWLDKVLLLANTTGSAIYEKMRLGQPVEVSTGYYAPGVEDTNGKFNGMTYKGIHRNLHPDHIALLSNGNTGNCSVMDGCGLNRNSNSIITNCGDSKNCTKADCPMKDVMDKSQKTSASNPVTTHIRQPATQLRDWFADATQFTKESLMNNATLSAFLQSIGFSNVKITDGGEAGLSVALEGTGNDAALDGLVQLNQVVQAAGSAADFIKTFEAARGMADQLAAMQVQMNERLAAFADLKDFAASVTANQAATKLSLVTGLIANRSNLFDEGTLNSMSVPVLEKLAQSYQPVDWSGLGGMRTNSAEGKPLPVPEGYLSLVGKAV